MLSSDTPKSRLKLSCPKGWTDRSMYIYAAPAPDPETGFEANIVVTQLQLPLTGSFEAHIKQEYDGYKSQMEAFALIHQRKGQVQKSTAHELLFTWQPDDFVIKQRVIFLKAGLKRLITFSASAAQADYNAQEPFFNEVLTSLNI